LGGEIVRIVISMYSVPGEGEHMQQVEPISVIDLFPQERRQLLALFSSLSAEDWARPTVCPGWTVKDIGLHLLGDDIGYLSGVRDHFSNPFFKDKDMREWESLVKNLDEGNELWVRAAARVSPRLLIELLELTGKQFYEYVQTLDQMKLDATVSWAGPDPAPRWLDTAREYTERWVHQQQIRDAVHLPGLKERHFFHPVLAAFVWALPHTYKDTAGVGSAVVKLVVTGEAGGIWYVVRDAGEWFLCTMAALPSDAVVTMDQETCWRLFTRGVSKDEAAVKTTIEGDQRLGTRLLDTVSIIA
jgi:uncharacterized protein (TIGR03083 family)